MHSPLIDIVLALIGILGYLLASHIRVHKKKAKPLVCPLHFSCDTVIHSDYSKFLGIPVEFLGMLYYGIITALHLSALLFPYLLTPVIILCLLGLSACAFLFSIYLLCVQAFILKQWCTWCLASAFLCSVIFLITFGFYV